MAGRRRARAGRRVARCRTARARSLYRRPRLGRRRRRGRGRGRVRGTLWRPRRRRRPCRAAIAGRLRARRRLVAPAVRGPPRGAVSAVRGGALPQPRQEQQRRRHLPPAPIQTCVPSLPPPRRGAPLAARATLAGRRRWRRAAALLPLRGPANAAIAAARVAQRRHSHPWQRPWAAARPRGRARPTGHLRGLRRR